MGASDPSGLDACPNGDCGGGDGNSFGQIPSIFEEFFLQDGSSSGPAVWDTFTHLWEKAQLAGTLESAGVPVSGGQVLLAQEDGERPLEHRPLEGGGGAAPDGGSGGGGGEGESLNISEPIQHALDRIQRGEKLPYRNDGTIFQNREGRLPPLPKGGVYREYVVPTPNVKGPGAQRLVIGTDGSIYFTSDHYENFSLIKGP